MLRKVSVVAGFLALCISSGVYADQGVSLASGFTDFTTWDKFGTATATNTPSGNGSTYSDLQLTQPGAGGSAGAAFAPTALALDFNQSFIFDFHFSIAGTPTGTRGDGLTFTLSSFKDVGGAGSSLGYEGLSNSVAFAVDTFNFTGEPESPSLQILQNGSITPLAFTETGLGDDIRNPSFQFYATLTYAPSGLNDEKGTLTGTIFNPALSTFTVSSAVDLSQLGVVLDTQGNPAGHLVYYGFTAANGLADDGHSITSGIPLPVPEPSTYAMLLSGFAMLVFVARRRWKQQQF